MSHKLDETACDGLGKRYPVNIARTIGTALVIGCNSGGTTTLQNSVSERVIRSRRRWVSLGRLVDHRRSANDNMVGSAQEAAMMM